MTNDQHDNPMDLQTTWAGGLVQPRTQVDVDPHCRHCHTRIFHVTRFDERIWVHGNGNATCALTVADPEDGVA